MRKTIAKHSNNKGFTHANSRESLGGFTLIELMFATLIFSIVMIILLASFLQIGRMFYKGISMARTQDASRSVVDSLSDDIRFAADQPIKLDASGKGEAVGGSNPNLYYFCVGDHRYTYQLKKKIDPSAADQIGMRRDTTTSCDTPPISAAGLKEVSEMLGPDMQLNAFNLACNNGRCTVGVHIIFYGADNLVFTSSKYPDDTDADRALALLEPDAECSGGLISSQFCATATLSTTVLESF